MSTWRKEDKEEKKQEKEEKKEERKEDKDEKKQERKEDKEEKKQEKEELKRERLLQSLKDDERYSRGLKNFEDTVDCRLQILQLKHADHTPSEYVDALHKQIDKLEHRNNKEDKLFRALLNMELSDHLVAMKDTTTTTATTTDTTTNATTTTDTTTNATTDSTTNVTTDTTNVTTNVERKEEEKLQTASKYAK